MESEKLESRYLRRYRTYSTGFQKLVQTAQGRKSNSRLYKESKAEADFMDGQKLGSTPEGVNSNLPYRKTSSWSQKLEQTPRDIKS